MSSNKSTLTLHIDNLTEDVLTFVITLPSEARKFEIQENGDLADRSLFYYTQASDLLLLVPKPIEPAFLNYFLEIFPKKTFRVLSPSVESGELSLDIMKDKRMVREFSKIIKKYESVKVHSYSSTSQFYELVNVLHSLHPNIIVSQSPAVENSWTVDFFGSKVGLRSYRYSKKGKEVLPMCEGESVFGLPQILIKAAEYFKKYGGVVIKTNKGHAGMGVVIVEEKDISTKKSFESQLTEKLQESYWNTFPSVIEEFIPCDGSVGGGFPNAECFVDMKGNVQYLYSCGMRVTPSGQFKGVEVGREVLPPKVEKELRKFGESLGKMYAKAGYVGYFDIDCLYGKNGKLYLSESNVRRTGGTHVYLLALHLFGNNFAERTYALSNNTYQMTAKRKWKFKDLHKRLQGLLFDPVRKEGIFIVAANLLHRGVFGYVIFGKNKQSAVSIEQEMERLLLTD